MNFTEVVAQVHSVVRRAEKIPDIRREVNSAIAIFAQDKDFPQCFEELLVPINPAEYTQLVAMSEFTRHRKFKYIRRAATQKYLTELDLSNLMKNDCDLRDKYYVAGTNLKISMTEVAQNLDVGYYTYPPILTDASPEYWLLGPAWSAVFNRAASKVLELIGDSEDANKYERHAVAAWLGYRDKV